MKKQITGLEFKIQEMAARIREMREIIGYSVEQMAEKTGISVAEYEAVESGMLPVLRCNGLRIATSEDFSAVPLCL